MSERSSAEQWSQLEDQRRREAEAYRRIEEDRRRQEEQERARREDQQRQRQQQEDQDRQRNWQQQEDERRRRAYDGGERRDRNDQNRSSSGSDGVLFFLVLCVFLVVAVCNVLYWTIVTSLSEFGYLWLGAGSIEVTLLALWRSSRLRKLRRERRLWLASVIWPVAAAAALLFGGAFRYFISPTPEIAVERLGAFFWASPDKVVAHKAAAVRPLLRFMSKYPAHETVALGVLDKIGIDAFPVLETLAQDQDPKMRVLAARVFGRAGPNAVAESQLLEKMASEDIEPGVREAAEIALGSVKRY